MTDAERRQYRDELGDSNTQESRMEFQAQHEQEMQQRALQQGQDLVPPGQGPIYGGEFMTVQERNQYREQLRLIDSDQEREKFEAQHRERVNQRANALGLDVEGAE
jgi:predicted RecB family nuclease